MNFQSNGIFILVGIVTPVLISALGCGPGAAVAPTTYQVWLSPDEKFQIEYPDGWSADGGGASGNSWARFENGSAKISIQGGFSGSGASTIGTNIDGTKISDELMAVTRIHEQRISKVAKDFGNYVEKKPGVMVDSRFGDIRRGEFTATSMVGGTIRGYHATAISRDRRFTIVCYCPESDWETLRPAYETVVRTIGRHGSEAIAMKPASAVRNKPSNAAVPQSKTLEASSRAIAGTSPSVGSPGRTTAASPLQKPGNQATAKSEEEKKPARPENIADWSFDDFASARIDGDPRLVEAVGHIVGARANDADVVEMLVGLLRIDPEKQPKAENLEAGSKGVQPGTGIRRPPHLVGAARHGRPQRGLQRGRAAPPKEHRWVSRDVAEAIIAGLGTSNAPEALAALKNLLDGKQRVPLPQDDCVAGVINALTTNINRENESVLFSMITTPDHVKPYEFTEQVSNSPIRRGGRFNRPPTRGGPPGRRGFAGARNQRRNPTNSEGGLNEEWIQEEVLAHAGGIVSKKFRIALAKFMADPDVVIETAQLVENFLSEDDPRNDAAQVLLIRNSATDAKIRTQLEDMFIYRSSEVMRELLAIPESTMSAARSNFGRRGFNRQPPPFRRPPAGRPATGKTTRKGRKSRLDEPSGAGEQVEEKVEEPDPEQRTRQQVVLLWRGQVAEMLRKTMMSKELDDVDTRVPLLLGTMPLIASRAAVSEILQTSSGAGPDQWTEMGMFSSTTTDPALLIYGKQQYHRAKGRSGGSDDDADDTWSDPIERYVEDLCERFRNAKPVGNANEETIPVSKLPARIHRRGNVVARYDLNWPGSVGKKWKRFDIAPLELHYVRLEEEDAANQTVFHYRHHTKGAREVKISNGVWFDSFNHRDQLSVDVRITTSEGGGLGVPVGDELKKSKGGKKRGNSAKTKFERKKFVVEILTVGIPTSETG